jgi:hypothetical protein
MPRFTPPNYISSLKDARYWSLEWVKENDIQGPFHYIVLQKTADGGYQVHGEYATATEAFDDRRRLVDDLGTRSLFLRAVRVQPDETVGPSHPDSREDLDRYRDALATGDETLIAEAELPAFRQWAAREIQCRSAYRRVDRDAPRFVDSHDKIPF